MKQVCGKNCANAMYKDGDPNTYCRITDTECFDCLDMMNMFEEIPKDFLGIPGKEVEGDERIMGDEETISYHNAILSKGIT